MRLLYHLWLSPPCRAARIVLGEKGLGHRLEVERTWARRNEFLALNPTGEVPVLVEDNGAAIAGGGVICEYLDEAYGDVPMLGSDPLARAESRRIADWFDRKFNAEVTVNLVDEKVMKRFLGLGQPDSQAIRAGLHNIATHLDYIGYLSERRRWLAGDEYSLADITAAAHLSCVDYLGDVPWADHEAAKQWYARVKSRPSFRPLLSDRIPGLKPPRHYGDLDF